MSIKPRKKKVVFSIPTLDGSISAGIDMFIRACERESENPNVPWRFSTNVIRGYSPHAYARNRLVQIFLEDKEADLLWFLDADVIPPLTAVDLLAVNADIAAGLYPIWSTGGGDNPSARFCIYQRMSNGQFIEKICDEERGQLYVDAAGTGCMIIKRQVLEDPRMRHESEYYDFLEAKTKTLPDDAPPPVFKWTYLPNGKTLTTEDIEFCVRAKGHGYSIKAHAGVRCGHMKLIDLIDVRAYRSNGIKEALERAAA